VESRRCLGVSAESVWLVPKPSGGGVAVVYLEALDPERALRALATSEAFFGSCYSGGMRKLFGLIWRGYYGQRAASSFSLGAMMFRASVRRGKTHGPTPQLAKDGICEA
jgi:hypothetical protein